MNMFRSLIVLPLTVVAFLAPLARGQLTCDAPQQVGLGATPFATLLSFPSHFVAHPCSSGPTEICRATFLRFTAPQDGWYSAYVIPALSPSGSSWIPRISAMLGCGPTAAESFGFSRWTGCNDAGDACGPWRQFTSVTFWLQSGQSRTLAVGGNSPNDAGSGQIRVERVGASRFDGAVPLAVGQTDYTVGPLAPTIPFSWECGNGSMPNARRFTFTAPKSGSFRISFCSDPGSQQIAASEDPTLPSGQTQTTSGGCPASGGRIIIQAQQGTTYYILAGYENFNDGYCLQHQATVEYVDPCPADFNDDDVTDGVDLGILLAAWGTSARDITGDGTTDGVDLGILLAMWGACPD
jgi:hypothetical protein